MKQTKNYFTLCCYCPCTTKCTVKDLWCCAPFITVDRVLVDNSVCVHNDTLLIIIF